MITPLNHLIGTISHTLEHDVLPFLESSDWVASRLRSSLMLLRHMELRVEREGQFLEEVSGAADSLLAESVALFATRSTSHPVFEKIQGSIEQPESSEGYFSLEAMRDQNQALMILLDELVVTLNENPRDFEEGDLATFKQRLHEFFYSMSRKEGEMFAIGEGYSPL